MPHIHTSAFVEPREIKGTPGKMHSLHTNTRVYGKRNQPSGLQCKGLISTRKIASDTEVSQIWEMGSAQFSVALRQGHRMTTKAVAQAQRAPENQGGEELHDDRGGNSVHAVRARTLLSAPPPTRLEKQPALEISLRLAVSELVQLWPQIMKTENKGSASGIYDALERSR